MAICRYYQQGHCHHGSNCRFEHVGGGFGGGGNVFGQTSNTQSPGGQQQLQGPELVNTLVTTVKRDLEQSEGGKQWSFSCYSPAKDCPSIPGLDDLSPEELRHEAYTANKSNTATQYQQRYQQLVQDYAQKRKCLLNPSQEMKEVFRRVYNKETVPPSATLFTNSGATSAGGIFGGGGAASPASIFGGGGGQSAFTTKPASAASIFGGGTGSTTTQPSSIFGGPATTTSSTTLQSSVFGGGGTSQVFGQKPTIGQSIFGQSQMTNNASSPAAGIFGGGSAQPVASKPTASIFGTPTATANSGSVFGQPAAPSNPASSVFGSQPTSMTTQPATSAFGQPASLAGASTQQNTGFGTQMSAVPEQTSSIFGQPPAFGSATTTPNASGSVFGQQPSQVGGGSIFGQPAAATGSATTPGGGIFGQPPQHNPQQAAATDTSNPFANPTATPTTGALATSDLPAVPSSNPFGSTAASAPTNPTPASTNLFGAPVADSKNSGLFGQAAVLQRDDSIYTAESELTQEELAAYKADAFELGKIPEKPPPQAICV